jgi:sortase A
VTQEPDTRLPDGAVFARTLLRAIDAALMRCLPVGGKRLERWDCVRRRRGRRLMRWVEYGAWAIGCSLLLLYAAARLYSETARQEGLAEFQRARVVLDQTAGPPLPVREPPMSVAGVDPPPPVDQSLWSSQRVRAFAESIASPGVPQGVLRVPALQIAVPIYAGTSEINLNRGAAHIEGTAALATSGNIGIAAHRDGFFRKLKDIAIDADVYLDSGSGSRRYRVVEISVVMPTEIHVLAPTEIPSVTLVTCYPFYFLGDAPQRYIVRAELADAPPAASEGATITDVQLNSNVIRSL